MRSVRYSTTAVSCGYSRAWRLSRDRDALCDLEWASMGDVSLTDSCQYDYDVSLWATVLRVFERRWTMSTCALSVNAPRSIWTTLPLTGDVIRSSPDRCRTNRYSTLKLSLSSGVELAQSEMVLDRKV